MDLAFVDDDLTEGLECFSFSAVPLSFFPVIFSVVPVTVSFVPICVQDDDGEAFHCVR